MSAADREPRDPGTELHALTQAYCDGTLARDEWLRLERRLRGDAEARARFRRYLSLDAALHDYGQGNRQPWLEAATRSSGVSSTNQSARFFSGNRRTVLSKKRFMLASALGAMITTAITLAIVLTGQPASAEVTASLEQVIGDVRILGADGQMRSITGNTPIRAGEMVRISGNESSSVVAYDDGTRLTLVGDTSMTCGDRQPKSVIVHQGTLAASVRRQPPEKPMLLTTPSAQVQVLGTHFMVRAATNRTDLRVTEGLLRVVRTNDGSAVDVSDGKQAVVTAQNPLTVRDIPIPSSTWSVDFESGLPEGWDVGERVTEGLPPGSRGAVRAARHEEDGESALSLISSNESWMTGLFAAGKASHLHFTFKMERPNWFNVLIVTRTADPHEPRFAGNYLLKDFPLPGRGQWQTLTVPLSHFAKIHQNVGPLHEVVPYKLTFFSDEPDRGLVIDRIWVTPDGPGELVMTAID